MGHRLRVELFGTPRVERVIEVGGGISRAIRDAFVDQIAEGGALTRLDTRGAGDEKRFVVRIADALETIEHGLLAIRIAFAPVQFIGELALFVVLQIVIDHRILRRPRCRLTIAAKRLGNVAPGEHGHRGHESLPVGAARKEIP